MQIFIPSPSFEESVTCLDNKRLFNQRNEAIVITKVLAGEITAWKNHPGIRMWEGYLSAVVLYLLWAHQECVNRNLPISKKTANSVFRLHKKYGDQLTFMPKWWSREIHSHHRSKLLSKDPEHYGQFGWPEEPDPRSWYPVPWGKKQLTGYGE